MEVKVVAAATAVATAAGMDAATAAVTWVARAVAKPAVT